MNKRDYYQNEHKKRYYNFYNDDFKMKCFTFLHDMIHDELDCKDCRLSS